VLDPCAGTDDPKAVVVTEARFVFDAGVEFGILFSLGLPTVFEPSTGLDTREAPFETELAPGIVPTFVED